MSAVKRIPPLAHHTAGAITTQRSYLHLVPRVKPQTPCLEGMVIIMDRDRFGDRDISIWQLAMGWMVRGSNTGLGEIFRTRSDRPRDPFGTLGTQSLSGG